MQGHGGKRDRKVPALMGLYSKEKRQCTNIHTSSCQILTNAMKKRNRGMEQGETREVKLLQNGGQGVFEMVAFELRPK